MKKVIYSSETLNQFSTFEIHHIESILASTRIVKGSKRYIADLESRRRFSDEVFQFIDEAYDYLGGFRSFKDMDRFINDSYLWYITYDGPEPASEKDLEIERVYVISVYRLNHGMKLVGIARRRLAEPGSLRVDNDEVRIRSNAALAAHLKFMAKHGWAEVSDRLESKCKEILGEEWIINPQYLIDNNILKGIEIDPYDETRYFRELRKGGPTVNKIAYGTPKV